MIGKIRRIEVIRDFPLRVIIMATDPEDNMSTLHLAVNEEIEYGTCPKGRLILTMTKKENRNETTIVSID